MFFGLHRCTQSINIGHNEPPNVSSEKTFPAEYPHVLLAYLTVLTAEKKEIQSKIAELSGQLRSVKSELKVIGNEREIDDLIDQGP